MAYLDDVGYFYRMRPASLTHLDEEDKNRQILWVCEKIKNQEYDMGHICWALKWDKKIIWGILSDYLTAKRKKDSESCRHFRQMMMTEIRHPLYKEFPGNFGDISRCTSFEELPDNAKAYIGFIEEYMGIPVKFIGTGADREEMLVRE